MREILQLRTYPHLQSKCQEGAIQELPSFSWDAILQLRTLLDLLRKS